MRQALRNLGEHPQTTAGATDPPRLELARAQSAVATQPQSRRQGRQVKSIRRAKFAASPCQHLIFDTMVFGILKHAQAVPREDLHADCEWHPKRSKVHIYIGGWAGKTHINTCSAILTRGNIGSRPILAVTWVQRLARFLYVQSTVCWQVVSRNPCLGFEMRRDRQPGNRIGRPRMGIILHPARSPSSPTSVHRFGRV